MTTNRRMLKTAKKLACKYVLVRTSKCEIEDSEHIWLAEDLDLVGCMAQGATREEAYNNLKDSRIDFIYFLLEDGMDIPPPTL